MISPPDLSADNRARCSGLLLSATTGPGQVSRKARLAASKARLAMESGRRRERTSAGKACSGFCIGLRPVARSAVQWAASVTCGISRRVGPGVVAVERRRHAGEPWPGEGLGVEGEIASRHGEARRLDRGKVLQAAVEEMGAYHVAHRVEDGFQPSRCRFFPFAQHGRDLLALQVLLRAAERAGN